MAGDGRAETSEPLEREADAGVAVGDAVVGVLITFPMSHYCEKARWALDHAGVGYRERGYAPALHKIAVHRHHSRTAPVLLATETLLGIPARRWFYAWALLDPARLYPFAACGLGPSQRTLLRVLAPRITRMIAGRFELGAGGAARARELIDDEFDRVGQRLADGRDYLCGERFSAADLTFAALVGPLLHPPGYGGDRFALPPIPDELAPQVHAWRDTPAGRHAARVYREHRRGADNRCRASRHRASLRLGRDRHGVGRPACR